MATTTKKRTKRAKQERIPGTEPVEIKEVVDASAALYAVRKERMDLTDQETKLADRLIEVCKKHKVTAKDFEAISEEYELKIKSEAKMKVSVRLRKQAEGNSEE